MIKIEVAPREIPAGDLEFLIGSKIHFLYYYNKDPYHAIILNNIYYEAGSYPSYLVFNNVECCYYYGTYMEIKKELIGKEPIEGPKYG